MKKNRLINNIDIDLTSLLDIVLILLFLVMAELCISDINNDTQPEVIIEPADAQEYVTSITVYADYEPNNVTTRTIYLRSTAAKDESLEGKDESNVAINGDTPKEYILTQEDETKFDEFMNDLDSYLYSNSESPVLLTLNEEQILYRDHEKMWAVIKELQNKHNNLYCTNTMGTN